MSSKWPSPYNGRHQNIRGNAHQLSQTGILVDHRRTWSKCNPVNGIVQNIFHQEKHPPLAIQLEQYAIALIAQDNSKIASLRASLLGYAHDLKIDTTGLIEHIDEIIRISGPHAFANARGQTI